LKISPARTASFDVLTKIECDQAFSAAVLPAAKEGLAPNDAALCHELVLGILRRRIYLDRVIDHLANSKKLDPAVRMSLRLGIYQLSFLDRVPAHAAINESVELVRREKKTSAKGLVNAILRRVQADGMPDLTFSTEIEKIAVETSHPEWLIERWISQFGFEAAAALARANNRTPRITFRRTAAGASVDLSGYESARFVPGASSADRITPDLAQLALDGLIYFQDEASQMVGRAVASGASFLDVCAAPGGKTTMITAESDPLASIAVAGDLHWKRVEFLRDNCRRQGVGFVNIVQYDAVAGLPFAEGVFESILVDAPCSGTGTIAHNPEIRYRLKIEDLGELSDKQLQILENASKLVSTGGTLVYATCSLEREENESVCERFLSAGSFISAEPDVPRQFITNEGFARTYPHRDHMEGFFLAKFQKL
jgi:16S rRNA (cytosine967-C5)-methyltransferase